MHSQSLRVVRGLLAGFLWVGLCGHSHGAAAPKMLDSALLLELAGSVWVMDPGQPLKRASLKQKVAGPSAVKTGEGSRAAMEFPEGSLVRIGANAVFSFRRGTRELSLEEGALLLRVPKGIGAPTTVRTAAATAAITGTTVIISATKKGGFRMVVLEGVAEARYADRVRVRCRAGDMTVRQPGQPGAGSPSQVHLGSLMKSSQLVNGFKLPLPSLELIQEAIRLQDARIGEGTLSATGRTLDATTLDQLRSDRDPGLIQDRNRHLDVRPPIRDKVDTPRTFPGKYQSITTGPTGPR